MVEETKRLSDKCYFCYILDNFDDKSWKTLYNYRPAAKWTGNCLILWKCFKCAFSETIQVRRTRHLGHCKRNKDEFVSNVLLWTPTYGRTNVNRPAKTYVDQLCLDTGCRLEKQLGAMNDRNGRRERKEDSMLSARLDNDDDDLNVLL